MDSEIYLIKAAYAPNEIGVMVAAEGTPRRCLCDIRDVYRSEWAAAGQLGHQPQLVAVLPFVDYEGEQTALYHGRRYSVYRTHEINDGWDIELYLEERTGVTHAGQ